MSDRSQPLTPALANLPVAECFEPLAAATAAGVPVVLKAPPGAGKSTGIPPELLRRGVAGNGQMLLIQPRRLAARSVACRLAERLQTPLGQQVGYHVRFDRQVSAATRLIVMTTGMLLRRLTFDPLLDNVSCVILDEFHERSLEADLALGMLQRIRVGLRPELKLLVMSATLDPTPIVAYLGDAIALTSEGRSFPVNVRYTDTEGRTRLSDRVAAMLPTALRETPGDLLVFLPGVGEIKATRRAIEAMRLPMQNSLAVHELFGNLSARDQDAVLTPSAVRKIVLATNVAETSVTIPGVTGVIDSGLVRMLRFDSRVGLPKLQLEGISQASADQRAGRAGRTAPGCCWRLWSESVQRSRRPRDTPEIERADFSTALLTLASWGEQDVFDFPWLTLPRQESVDAAGELLRRLDALDPQGRITPLGRQMVELPLHPRMARLVIAAAAASDLDRAALAAAILTERDPFPVDDVGPDSDSSLPCDLLDRVTRLQRFREGRRSLVGNTEGARHVLKVASQIVKLAERPHSPAEVPSGHSETDETFKRALLAAYPDRVARRRGSGDDRGVLVGGRGVRLHRSSRCRDGEFFLCLDVDSAGSEATVRLASSVDPAWLDPRRLRIVDQPLFQPSLQAVVARRRRYFDDLLLSEAPIACPTGGAVAELLFQHARTQWASILPGQDSEAARFIERVRFLWAAVPDHPLAPLDEPALLEVLRSLCEERTSFGELRGAPWLDHLRGLYDYESLQWLERHAPTQLKLPSGNTAQVHYAAGKTPWMEARIQELFGWQETPRIAAGRVRLQLHLLGPNMRPQQITEDLASFWRETYSHVRKELRGRYPKHHWPEDPATATATPRGLKPK